VVVSDEEDVEGKDGDDEVEVYTESPSASPLPEPSASRRVLGQAARCRSASRAAAANSAQTGDVIFLQ